VRCPFDSSSNTDETHAPIMRATEIMYWRNLEKVINSYIQKELAAECEFDATGKA